MTKSIRSEAACASSASGSGVPAGLPQALSQASGIHTGSNPSASGALGVPALRQAFHRARRDRRGAVAMLAGMVAPVLIGFAGLAIDLADWETTKGAMQGVADRAALSAGIATLKGGGNSLTEARAIATNHGFVHGQGQVKVNVGRPASGIHAGNTSALEVTVSGPARLAFTRLFMKTPPIITARAVAVPSGGTCVLILGTSGTTLDIGGSGSLNLPNCNLYNNSVGAAGTRISGSGGIAAKNIFLSGNYARTGSGTIAASETLRTYSSAVRDPYAGRTIPTYSGCDHNNLSVRGSTTFNASGTRPFVFCGGLRTSGGGGGTLTFGPGIYVFDTGAFDLTGGQWNIVGDNVTLIFSSGTGASQGMRAIGANFTLRAPSTGATSGIAIWVDGKVSSSDITINGNASLTGAIYAPNARLVFGGNSGSPCTQLIAQALTAGGNAHLEHNCTGTGVSDVGGGFRLAE